MCPTKFLSSIYESLFFFKAGMYMTAMQFVASLAQILFGASAAWIAYQQWILGKNKAKFEVYNKRYEAYSEFQKFLGSILRNGKVDAQDLVSFRWKFEEHFFLFAEDIHEYVKSVFEKALEMKGYENHLWGVQALPTGFERNAIVEKQNAALDWLIKQNKDGKRYFEKYLRIK